MPATPIRRHRPAAVLAAVVLGLGLLAGCAGQRAPGDYSDTVERNFLKGCTATAVGDDASFDAEQYCQCTYDALSADEGGVDFDTFKKVNDDQVEKPAALPKAFKAIAEDCLAEQSGESAAAGDDAVEQDSTTTTTEG